jgi:hypothetical protein
MKNDEILASLAVLVLSGVLVYLTKVGLITIGQGTAQAAKISANQAIDQSGITGAGGNPDALTSGPSIYLANTPWPYGPNDGNVIPPASAGQTIAGASPSDFLGFAAS